MMMLYICKQVTHFDDDDDDDDDYVDRCIWMVNR